MICAFGIVAVILSVVGVVGWDGVRSVGRDAAEIGTNYLSSVRALLMVSQAQSVCDGQENLLLSRDIRTEARMAAYKAMQAAYTRIDEGWAIYQRGPKSSKEEQIFRDAEAALTKWRADDKTLVEMAKQYDSYVEHTFAYREAYKALSDQSLKVIPEYYNQTLVLVNKLLEIYEASAQENPMQLDDLKAMYNIREAQTHIHFIENALLSQNLTVQERYKLLGSHSKIGFKIASDFSRLDGQQKTPEGEEIWSAFKQAWDNWKAQDSKFIAMAKKFTPMVIEEEKSNPAGKRNDTSIFAGKREILCGS